MSDFNEEQYQAAIPACCAYQTLREHMDSLLLCWGLAAAVRAGRAMDCRNCDLSVRPVGLARVTEPQSAPPAESVK
jgi:hypothetical protein